MISPVVGKIDTLVSIQGYNKGIRTLGGAIMYLTNSVEGLLVN